MITRVVPGALLTGFFRAFFALGWPPVSVTIDTAGDLVSMATLALSALKGRPRFLAPALLPADIILAGCWCAFCCCCVALVFARARLQCTRLLFVRLRALRPLAFGKFFLPILQSIDSKFGSVNVDERVDV